MAFDWIQVIVIFVSCVCVLYWAACYNADIEGEIRMRQIVEIRRAQRQAEVDRRFLAWLERQSNEIMEDGIDRSEPINWKEEGF